MGDCVEDTQSEIPRSARNDRLGRVITQTPRERAVCSLWSSGVQQKMWDMPTMRGPNVLSTRQDALIEVFVKGNDLLATKGGRGAMPRCDAHLLAPARVGDDLEGACGHGFHIMTRH